MAICNSYVSLPEVVDDRSVWHRFIWFFFGGWLGWLLQDRCADGRCGRYLTRRGATGDRWHFYGGILGGEMENQMPHIKHSEYLLIMAWYSGREVVFFHSPWFGLAGLFKKAMKKKKKKWLMAMNGLMLVIDGHWWLILVSKPIPCMWKNKKSRIRWSLHDVVSSYFIPKTDGFWVQMKWRGVFDHMTSHLYMGPVTFLSDDHDHDSWDADRGFGL